MWKLGTLAALLISTVLLRADGADSYEIWAADQNGNVIYVLAGGAVVRTLDVKAQVGGERPHTIHVSRDSRWLFAAHTVSNQATVHRLPDGAPVAVIDTVGKSPHAVQPHPTDPDRAYVCNIAPQASDAAGRPDRGESITELRRGADGRWTVSRRLDLKSAPALADTTRFPSRRPVLVGFSADGRQMLVTLFHGGAAIVDLEGWRVTEAWGADRMPAHSTVATASLDGRELYVTAGSPTTSWLYVFDVSGAPRLAASHDLARWGKDAHGAAVHPNGRELWVVHRASGTITVHPMTQLRQPHEPTVVSLGEEIPDLIEFGPDGRRAYVTLRGPKPAPTIPFPLAGRTPGVAVVDAEARRLVAVVPLGDPEESDFHGIAVVRTGS